MNHSGGNRELEFNYTPPSAQTCRSGRRLPQEVFKYSGDLPQSLFNVLYRTLELFHLDCTGPCSGCAVVASLKRMDVTPSKDPAHQAEYPLRG